MRASTSVSLPCAQFAQFEIPRASVTWEIVSIQAVSFDCSMARFTVFPDSILLTGLIMALSELSGHELAVKVQKCKVPKQDAFLICKIAKDGLSKVGSKTTMG